MKMENISRQHINGNISNNANDGQSRSLASYYITFVVSLLIFVLNGIVLVVLIVNRKDKNLKKVAFHLSTHCLCDIWSSSVLFSFRFPFIEPFSTRRDVCTALFILILLTQIVSKSNLTGLAFRKYLILKNINTLSNEWKSRTMCYLVLITITVAIVFIGLVVYLIPEEDRAVKNRCTPSFAYGNNTSKVALTFVVILAILLIITDVLSGLSIKKLLDTRLQRTMFSKQRKSVAVINNENNEIASSSSFRQGTSRFDTCKQDQRTKSKRDNIIRNALKTYLAAIICSNICYLLIIVYVTIKVSLQISSEFASDMIIIGPLLNSLLNPFIYVVSLKGFRLVLCKTMKTEVIYNN